jgi:outer membrane protein OmpA-like peptidoglycan-associated protein
MSRLTATASSLWLLSLLLLAAACGGGEKGQELRNLEALRDANYTRTIRSDPDENWPRVAEIRQRALDAVGQSDEWYEAALDAWEAAEDEKSEELSRQGILLYRAAEAYSRAADARERMEQANLNYQTQLERRNGYNDMAAANDEVISLLTALQRLYNETSDCRADMAGYTLEADTQAQAEISLAEARSLQRQAENMRADENASSAYQAGIELLTQATQMKDTNNYTGALETAMSAVGQFQQALQQSASAFESIRDRLLDDNDHQRLFDRAVDLFGQNAYLDARGLVVVVPGLFPERHTEILSDKTYILDQIADLLGDFRDVEITIEGHTSARGPADTNQGTSLARAEAVEDYFAQHDVRGRRMEVEGYGEDYPRYDNRSPDGRANNDRAEIVFKFE